MTLKLFGLKNCDTCKKALTELETAGQAPEFVDIRADQPKLHDLARPL